MLVQRSSKARNARKSGQLASALLKGQQPGIGKKPATNQSHTRYGHLEDLEDDEVRMGNPKSNRKKVDSQNGARGKGMSEPVQLKIWSQKSSPVAMESNSRKDEIKCSNQLQNSHSGKGKAATSRPREGSTVRDAEGVGGAGTSGTHGSQFEVEVSSCKQSEPGITVEDAVRFWESRSIDDAGPHDETHAHEATLSHALENLNHEEALCEILGETAKPNLSSLGQTSQIGSPTILETQTKIAAGWIW